MKVAIYSGTIPSTVFIERLIVGLEKAGIEIHLFGEQNKQSIYPKKVRNFGYSNRIDKLILFAKYSLLLTIFKPNQKKKLDQIIRNQNGADIKYKTKYYPVLFHQPDIFHIQWAKGSKDWMWVQEFGIKLVVSLRGTHVTISPLADEKLATSYRNCFPRINHFHAVSEAIANEAKKYGANQKSIKVVYSGLDLMNFPFKLENNSNPTFKIISVGRLHWLKGYRYGIQTVANLKTANFNFQYTIIGIENDDELLFQRLQLNLENEITFIKQQQFKEIIKEIQSSDLLFLPSVEEGIANVVLEAMALGTLVLTTDCGGMNEVIIDGENGFIVPSRNVKLMYEKIKYISKIDKTEKQRIKNNARKTIENRFSSKQMIKGMIDLYNSI